MEALKSKHFLALSSLKAEAINKCQIFLCSDKSGI